MRETFLCHYVPPFSKFCFSHNIHTIDVIKQLILLITLSNRKV